MNFEELVDELIKFDENAVAREKKILQFYGDFAQDPTMFKLQMNVKFAENDAEFQDSSP